MDILYRAHATASGGGREDGAARTDDGKIDVRLSTPTEMGGKGGDGTNPEQLFAAGYAACFLGALRLVSGKAGAPVGPDTTTIEDLIGRAHAVCPYSNATRGNVDVRLSAG